MENFFTNTQILKHTLMMKKLKTLFTLVLGLLSMEIAFAQGGNVKYKDGNTALEGYLVKTKAGAPGVVILHQWMGLSEHERNSANKLAQLGYNALAADVYGEGIRPKNVPEAGQLAGSYKKDYQLYQSRIKAAIAELIRQGADPSRIAVMGYCFGGTGAIEAARGALPIAGAISFHGSLLKDKARPNGVIQTQVLVLHGADDPYETEAEIKDFQQEMREAKADWEMVYYANAVHAFTQIAAGNDNTKGAAYNELADKRSWERLKSFLTEIFTK
jgi:dienelactone hydrolase